MSEKADLIAALHDDGGIDTIRQVLVGEMSEITDSVTDAETAMIAIAKVEMSLHNNFFMAFSGQPIFEIFLRGMQLTPQLTTLTMLAMRATSGSYPIGVMSPVAGVSYLGCIPVYVSSPDAAKVVVSFSGGAVVVPFMGNGEFYIVLPTASGTYSVRIIATDANGKQQAETVEGVIVEDFAVTPADGTTVSALSTLTASFSSGVEMISSFAELNWGESNHWESPNAQDDGNGTFSFDVSASGAVGSVSASVSFSARKIAATLQQAWGFIVGEE